MKQFMQTSSGARPSHVFFSSLSTLALAVLLFLFTSVSPYASEEPSELIAQAIRYSSQEAGEVVLVWGINNWKRMPDEQRPAGTLIKNSVMHTPMTKHGDQFAVTLFVKPDTMIDFGFLVTRTKKGVDVLVWEGDGKDSFHRKARDNHVISVSSKVTLLQGGKIASDKWDSIPYLMIPILCFLLPLKTGIFIVRHRHRVWHRRILLPAFTKPSRPSSAGDAIIIAISLLIGLALTEGILFILNPDGGFGAARPLEWVRKDIQEIDKSIIIDPAVGLRPRLNHGMYNEYGTVTNNYPLNKSPDTVRILALGSAAIWGGQLVEALRETYPEEGVEVWNGGIPSYGTVQTINFYQQFQSGIQADTIILFITSGDIETTPIAYRDDHQNIVAMVPYLASSSLNPFLFANSRLYRLLAGLRTLVSDSEDAVLQEVHVTLSDFAVSLRKDRKDLLVVLLPLLFPEDMWSAAEKERRAAILDVLRSTSIRYVDLLPPFREAIDDKLDVRQHAGNPFEPTLGLARRFAAYLNEHDVARRIDASVGGP